jgi:hypothetical protein
MTDDDIKDMEKQIAAEAGTEDGPGDEDDGDTNREEDSKVVNG